MELESEVRLELRSEVRLELRLIAGLASWRLRI